MWKRQLGQINVAARSRTYGPQQALRSLAAGPSRSLQTAPSPKPADGPPVSQTNRAEASMKRFWKDVELAEVATANTDPHLVIKLDNRALKTPGGNLLALPKSRRLAASLVAHEWENQEKLIKPYALPMTSLVSRAIDGLRDPETRAEVRKALLKYLQTDAICYHEAHPPALARLQEKHWHPLLEQTRAEYGVEINPIESILSAGQPAATGRIFEAVIEDFDEWEMAALERSVYATKSFITALALVRGRISVDDASHVAHVEVLSQVETWGEVEDTHDVDYRDIRRQLGSAACLLVDT